MAAVATLALAAALDPSGAFVAHRLPLATAALLTLPDVAAEARGVFLWAGLHAFATLAAVAFKGLWLSRGTGNANFLFNAHLTTLAAAGSVVADYVAAALRLQRRARDAAAVTRRGKRASDAPAGGGIDTDDAPASPPHRCSCARWWRRRAQAQAQAQGDVVTVARRDD